MIPVQLTLSGFLSYQEPVTLDFRTFDLACISGANGAGKSTLLDAITWALFGQARKRDDSVINLNPQVTTARVEFIFELENNEYRVERISPRGKTTVLEFHIRTPEGGWKPLTERASRATQARIEESLRLDYETFVNASFFLQGNADQFTQQRPGDRKQILGKILGLQRWERYREQAVQSRKGVEDQVRTIDGRIQEINAELAEEEERVALLRRLEAELQQSQARRQEHAKNLEKWRKLAADLENQAQLVDRLAQQAEESRAALARLNALLAERRQEEARYAEALANAADIEAAYAAWQETRARLAEMERVAGQFRDAERQRQGPLLEIEKERLRLESEQAGLLEKQAALAAAQEQHPALTARLENAQAELAAVEAELSRRAALETALQTEQAALADLKSQNTHLKEQMELIKERIQTLETVAGALCPLCGQPLPPDDRARLLAELREQGSSMGDLFRANKRTMEALTESTAAAQKDIQRLGNLQEQARALARHVDQLAGQAEALASQAAAWEAESAPRLAAIRASLSAGDYALPARTTLAAIDQELARLGYDAAAHDALRTAEKTGQAAEAALRTLEKAAAALEPLQRELHTLNAQAAETESALTRQRSDHAAAQASLDSVRATLPDLMALEREVNALIETENRLRMSLGAARQEVAVLDTLKTRRAAFETERELLAAEIARLKQLERAFGKDGVPALLIEQALPQIEAQANHILDRLSNGAMSVHFVTQREYKDKSRDDLRETLDILISDAAGLRDYEMYSGGEAFRVNFAIRLALSEVLAQRAGARLQTLVIDEGFGSQDAIGRQRLVEAINEVRKDFAKIIVITHIDELKDAFPTRIEVEKRPTGSALRVV